MPTRRQECLFPVDVTGSPTHLAGFPCWWTGSHWHGGVGTHGPWMCPSQARELQVEKSVQYPLALAYLCIFTQFTVCICCLQITPKISKGGDDDGNCVREVENQASTQRSPNKNTHVSEKCIIRDPSILMWWITYECAITVSTASKMRRRFAVYHVVPRAAGQVIQAGRQNLPRVPSLCLSSWLVWAGYLSSICLSKLETFIEVHSTVYIYKYVHNFNIFKHLYIISTLLYRNIYANTSVQMSCLHLIAFVRSVRQAYLYMRTLSTLLV